MHLKHSGRFNREHRPFSQQTLWHVTARCEKQQGPDAVYPDEELMKQSHCQCLHGVFQAWFSVVCLRHRPQNGLHFTHAGCVWTQLVQLQRLCSECCQNTSEPHSLGCYCSLNMLLSVHLQCRYWGSKGFPLWSQNVCCEKKASDRLVHRNQTVNAAIERGVWIY